jgi:radical SAM protein with 4Fe4S-binding SPASM domain
MSDDATVIPFPLPRFVQIEPVGQCNLRCRMCPVAYRGDGGSAARDKPPAFMSFDTFCRILDQFPAVTELQLQGLGEPFLHPRFLDMVRYAAQRGIEVSTNTNLTALSERRAAECVRSGLRRLCVSIDAAEAPAYEEIRIGSKLGRVLQNLEWLLAAKRRLGSDEPQVTLVAVAMRRNLDQLPALVRLAGQYGVNAVSVQHLAHDFSEDTLPPRYRPMREFVDAESLLNEDPARVAQWFDAARAVALHLGIALRLPRVRPGPIEPGRTGRERCDWPWRGAYVSFAGDAMPCCMIATPDRMNLGNMAREGVARVWNSAEYQAFRARLDSADPPEICRGCAVYNGTF